MGKEFRVIKEVSTISATIAELAAVNKIICHEIPAADFRAEYDSLILDIINTYRVVVDTITPLTILGGEEIFVDAFPETAIWYGEHYQSALSQPRINAELTFEKYLQFRKRKETKTSYPLLKITFARLHDLIDKWIDNDIWLAMSIDTVFKTLNLVITELQELYAQDKEEAFYLYQSGIGQLPPYLAIISEALRALEQTRIGAAVCTPDNAMPAYS